MSGSPRAGASAREAARWAVLLTALLVVSSLGLFATTATAVPPASSGAQTAGTAIPPPADPIGLSNNTTVNATGPGTFYSTADLPAASYADETCVSGSCYDLANDVATTVTPGGLLVAAYTIFSDQSPCASLRPLSVTNIALVTSSNGGRTWSAIHYLGNSVCAATGYPDAWEPTLATLANGTLVLAYVEYGLPTGELPLSAWPPTESRLVLTESFDSGTSWTTPQVLNISNPSTAPPGLQFTPAFPSLATTGNTIYVTWMSLTTENAIGSIALLVSSNGGAQWSPTIPVATGYQAGYSMNPQATIGPSGELAIAYTSNITQSSFWCTEVTCYEYFPAVWVGSVWVATSDSNGTIFNYSQVAANVPLGSPSWDPNVNPVSYAPFETPAPQIAYANATGQLFVAFSGGEPANGSTYCFLGADECFVDDLFFYNSSNAGSTWSAGAINTTVLNAADIDPSTSEANATDSVSSVAIATWGDEVDLEASVYSGTMCAGTTCGIDTEVVFSTTDNGSSFSVPATVAAAYTPYDEAYAGEYTSVAEINGSPRFFWALDSCPTWTVSPCGSYPGSNGATSQIVVSSYFIGTASATLSFVATGVTTPANWSVNVLGNVRGGLSNTTLSVSGVPTGIPIYFTVTGINTSGIAFYVLPGAISPASPATLAGNLTVTVAYREYVPVKIAYNAPVLDGPTCDALYGGISGCPSFYPGCEGIPYGGNYTEACFSYYFNPVPPSGVQWLPAGVRDTVGLLPYSNSCYYPDGGLLYNEVYCWIYVFYLEPLGWAGTGPGSVSTDGLNVSFVPLGPVTETASFFETGFCEYYYYQYPLGTPGYNYLEGCGNFTGPLTIQEQGLPAGSQWGVTLGGAAGNGTVTALAGQEIYNGSAALGSGSITPLTVPSNTAGEVYVGTLSIPSPLFLPLNATETVTYHLESVTSLNVPVVVSTLGLPAGLSGNATFTNTGTGLTYNVSADRLGVNVTLPGGDYVVTVSDALTTAGTSYLPLEVYANLALLGGGNESGTVPLSFELDGSATIVLAYGAEYWVAVSAGPGGSATPSSQWVAAGSSVELTATPDAGYAFVGWFGVGSGATTGAEDGLSRVAIEPGGPVTELATFEPASAVAYTIEVGSTGIPTNQPFSIEIGSVAYSGAGTFRISNLTGGTYAVSVPDQAAEGTVLARYAPVDLSASTGLSGNELTVASDLTLDVTFASQYLIAVATTGNGSVSGGAGSVWDDANSTLAVTATPDPGWVFSAWWISQNDAPSTLLGTSAQLAMVVTTSANLVAQFSPAPAHASTTYAVSFNETGLPSGTTWQVSLTPAAGVSGTGASLSESGLAGTYTVTVGTVYAAIGERYVPDLPANETISVTGNESIAITFQLQVLFTISLVASGQATYSESAWVNASTTVPLVAGAAPAGWAFVGWQGTGVGNYTGPLADTNVTPTAPITETATYAPITTTTASSGPSTSWTDYLAVALIAALLAGVGIAEGWSVMRKRRPPASPARPGSSRPAPASATPAAPGAGATGAGAASSPTPSWKES